MTVFPTSNSLDISTKPLTGTNTQSQSDSTLNISIPYVDKHYGSADGIIDPKEYASNYTDPATGITVYLEHNSSILYVGLVAATSGWIGFGWKNQSDDFSNDGLNRSDLVIGYAPGTPHEDYHRASGGEPVTIHYKLYFRNGTFVEEDNVPDDLSETPLYQESLLEAYKRAAVGMRIGEVRHFIIPAEDAYNTKDHPFYGFDLEYEITVTRIAGTFDDPTDSSEIVFSDEHGISPFNHLPDANQSRIISANASDDGSFTMVEYFIQMNSTDPNDIALLNNTETSYPMILMFGNNDDLTSLPVQHTSWSSPLMTQLTPNTPPQLIVDGPEQDALLSYVTTLKLNATDNSLVRRAYYKFDNENWTEISYDFTSDLWIQSVDLSVYETGPHTIWFNATDASDVNSLVYVNVTIDYPFQPLLGMRLDVSREIHTELYHTTEVRDFYEIRNNGSVSISAIEMLLPMDWSVYYLSFNVEDEFGNNLITEQLPDTQDFMRWRVHFAEPVGFQETYSVIFYMYFHSLHELVNFDEEQYDLKFLEYPVLPYVMNNFDFEIQFRSGDSLVTELPETLSENLAPFQIEEFTVTIKSFTPYVEADRITRITIDPWGWMTYNEIITIENIGPSKDTSFQYLVPAYATNIVVYDEVGILTSSLLGPERNFNETESITINLSRDRFGAQNAFYPGYKYTFHVDYVIQVENYNIDNVLEFPIGTMGFILVRSHIIDVVLPTSMTVSEVSGEYRLLYGVFDTTLRYSVYNTTEKNPAVISVAYSLAFGAATRPLVFALIIGVIAALYISYRKFESVERADAPHLTEGSVRETRQTGAPPDLLREFASLYSRKTALSMDLEKLEASLRRGKVKKREYLIRERDLKTQIQEIESRLPELKDKLMAHGSRYRDIIAQLELQEERIEGAKAGLRQLLLRKKRQRISRAAFEKTREDYLKTIKRATTEIDKILLSIQEEAGDI